jgi:hypothetical protein
MRTSWKRDSTGCGISKPPWLFYQRLRAMKDPCIQKAEAAASKKSVIKSLLHFFHVFLGATIAWGGRWLDRCGFSGLQDTKLPYSFKDILVTTCNFGCSRAYTETSSWASIAA